MVVQEMYAAEALRSDPGGHHIEAASAGEYRSSPDILATSYEVTDPSASQRGSPPGTRDTTCTSQT